MIAPADGVEVAWTAKPRPAVKEPTKEEVDRIVAQVNRKRRSRAYASMVRRGVPYLEAFARLHQVF